MKNNQTDFSTLYSEAIRHLIENKNQVIVVKTSQKKLRIVQIPDYMNCSIREHIENGFIDTLIEEDDTKVIACLAITSGHHPIIPSWNFLSKLISINSKNIDTEIYLWAGADNIFAKEIGVLLPPGK